MLVKKTAIDIESGSLHEDRIENGDPKINLLD